MNNDTPQVAAARIEAERARARLMETARELQDRLSPATLAQNAWEGAKSKGADLAEEAVDAVRRRPAIASGVVAAIALFLAREPLIDMAGKLADGVTSKRKTKKAQAAPRKTKGAAARKTKSKEKKTETIE